MVIFFFWVIWIWIVVSVLIDIFRRDDIGGWAKAAWVIFVVILPWLGVLIYLIAQHDGMRERRNQGGPRSEAGFRPIRARRCRRVSRRDRPGQAAARLGGNHPGRVRRDQGEGSRLERLLVAPLD
jgi:hypothetical protein